MSQTVLGDRCRGVLATAIALSLVAGSVPMEAAMAKPADTAVRQPHVSGQMQGDERILQALNRFTFGPRPGDLEAVRARGLDRWFTQQLHPQTINNSDLEARLTQFPAMEWNPQVLLNRLPSGAVIRQAAVGKIPVPTDGELHTIYSNEISRYEERQQQKQQQNTKPAVLTASANAPKQMTGATAAKTNQDGSAGIQMQPEAGQGTMAQAAEKPAMDQAQVTQILSFPPKLRVAQLTTLAQEEFDSFRKALKGPQKFALIANLNPAQREFVAALENPQRVVNDELAEQRLTRDIYSNAQLQEVMTDFWMNHFNVYLHKDEETPYYLVSYERDVIRPRALGKFEDLLEATAHSPAMMLYLDNSSSMGPDSPAAEKAKAATAKHPGKKQAPDGLNENYARELMELHTLGVTGGYTQADVTQVARVLTGWTVDKPQRGGDFKFDENRHEPGTKKILGKKIKEHGEQEGRELLHLLATRPATAHFVSKKLAVRFFGDDPPEQLVDRMAKKFESSKGDIAEVLTTLFHSPEFWQTGDYRAKVKTPLEFVVSAARASSANIENFQPLVNALRDMGMPLYGAVPPTGYKWDAADWVSTGALVNRMNFALSLAANKFQGVAIKWTSPTDGQAAKALDGSAPRSVAGMPVSAVATGPTPTPEGEEQRLETLLVAGGLSASTRNAVLEQFQAQSDGAQSNANGSPMPATVAAKPMDAAQAAKALEKQDQLLAGLLLGSPEFQRR